MDSLPLTVVSPPGPLRDQLISAVAPGSPAVLDTPEELLARKGDEWGVVVAGPQVSAEGVLRLLDQQARQAVPWVILLASQGTDGWEFRPASLGHAVSDERVLQVLEAPEEKGPLLDLHWTLRVVARARHDLNNPLTSGLAEAQLLLMDEHPQEVRESLETIQDQFRRLRDMVADLSRLRAPRSDSGH